MSSGPRVHDRDQYPCGPRCAARACPARAAATFGRFAYDFVDAGAPARFA
jgi:hypothetical protein